MSWLARSIATSLRIDDDNDAENDVASRTPHDSSVSPAKRNEEEIRTGKVINSKEQESEEEEIAHGRGVQEDLTELRQTFTRQFWGVASFLAPPPDHPVYVSNLDQSEPFQRSASSSDEREPSDSGIRRHFAEIGGRFKEISRMASDYFPFGSERNARENYGEENQEELETEVFEGEDDNDWRVGVAVGITDEVLAFARNIAMHPETWLDFPLDEEDDLDDFDMSDAQREHALAIERFAPRLAALRIELCPCHMSDSYFWKVYFVLLHSRLDKHDAEMLSSPQIMEARAMWIQELHKQTKPESDWFGRSNYENDVDSILNEGFECARTFDFEQTTSTTTDFETEKRSILSTKTHFIDKSVIEDKTMMKTEDKDMLVGASSKTMIPDYEEDDDGWLDEADSDLGGYKTIITVGNEEDISFSDLEDDASSSIPIKSTRVSEGTETKKP